MIRARFKQMENAYGISKLNVHFKEDSILYQSLIYSSNGTFKTSFSKSLYNLSNGNIDDIKDRLTDEKAKITIEFIQDDGSILTNDFEKKFIVFSRELYEKENVELSNHYNELSLLTIDNESKKNLNELLDNSINKIKDSLKSKLKKAGLNLEKSINTLTGKLFDDLNISDLQSIIEMVEKTESHDISLINLKNLFQKPYDPIDSASFKESACNYVEIFNKRLTEELFDTNFNDSNCMNFLDDIKKNSYLSEEKGRGIVLNGNEYYKYDEIDLVFKDAIKHISNDSGVLLANRELIKAMGVSIEAKKLQKQFQENPLLINQLALGKNNIILIALKNQGFEVDEFKTIIEDTKKEYSIIINNAREKQSDFEKAIEIYKTRFNPIFDILIINKEESILGESVPVLSFIHKRNKKINMSENDLRKILSSGEKTALNIISFIVEYEADKENNPILVLDDLVETFDYANRHSFIEYINDLVNKKVSIIILTHNYEFYRNLARRIPTLDKLSAYSENGKVYIQENRKLNKDIEKIFEIENINQFISAIPFLREIKMMLHEDTKILDSCLHYKENTKSILIKNIKDFFPPILFNENNEDSYISILYNLADKINVSNHYDIIPKIILSIACRIRLEEKIIGENFELIEDIETNQLAQLKEKYKEQLADKTVNLIEKVQISTPEFIHCNSFMYEPLIDIKGDYLVGIYNEIIKLKNDEIWKI